MCVDVESEQCDIQLRKNTASVTKTIKFNRARMPHTTNCKVSFDENSDRVYYGGQTVRGRVHLTLAKGKTIRGIYIEFLGKAHCHWTEGSGSKKETYTATEIYLDERQYLLGSRTGELHLDPGEYQYNFQVQLPLGVPTSLEAQVGHIRYGLQVVLSRPRWPDQKFGETFTVIKPLNLNHDITLRHPIVEEEMTRFNPFCLFACCASDPLFITASIPVSGYTSGQMINVDMELTNNSNENISAFVIQIVREVKFFTYENSSKHKIERDAIAEVETRGCYAQQKQAYTVDLEVPATPPSDATTSKIVHVKYHLKIEGLTGFCHMNPTIVIPITIGSYPILDQPPNYFATMSTIVPTSEMNITSNSYPNSNANASINVNVNSNVLSSAINNILNNEQVIRPQPITPPFEDAKPTDAEPSVPYPQHDPPTYEQAIKVFERKFAPNYPVYRRETSYSSQTNTPVLRRHCNP